MVQAFGCGNKQALNPTAASAAKRSCSAEINLYGISGCMSFAYTLLLMTGTEVVATPWLADALDTSRAHLMCVWYCHLEMHGVCWS